MSRVRSVRAWGSGTGPTACALAGRRCSLWGWRKGVPRGGAFHHCEGRLGSGAVPPPTARPLGGLLGSATHVLWVRVCGCGGPTLSPWRHALWGLRAAELAGGRPRGGWPATVVRGAWCQALSLPRPPVLWSGQPGFRDPCVPGAVGAGVGTQHRPHSVHPCGLALLAVGVAEGRPRGGCLAPLWGASDARRRPSPNCPPIGRAVGVHHPRAVGAGVWVWEPNSDPAACMPCGGCMPRGWWGAVPGGDGLPPLRGAPGVRRCPSPGRPSSGAGSQGSASHVSRLRSVRAWGPSTGPTACALAGWRCSLWGWRKGVPRGGAFHHCEGRLGSGPVPPPTARPLGGLLGSATDVLWARVCGCGGPTLFRWPARPVGAACRGGGGGPSPGGRPATVVRGAWCQALSLPRPPVLWSGQPGFRDPCVPGAVDAGVGTQHWPHGVRPRGPALLAVGVAEGRPRRGCIPPL